jgi:hypothetical protein
MVHLDSIPGPSVERAPTPRNSHRQEPDPPLLARTD